jgi:hypothetical protein
MNAGRGTNAMSENAGSANTAYHTRAGFWGRTLAFGIDLLLISVLIAVIGLASTGLTGGKVRVANTVVDFVDCTGNEPLPPELPDLDGFEGADARRCTRSLLGITHDRRLVVREKMTAGEGRKEQTPSQHTTRREGTSGPRLLSRRRNPTRTRRLPAPA